MTPVVTKVNEKDGVVTAKPVNVSRWRLLKIRFRYIYWQRLPWSIRRPFEYAYDHVVHGQRPVKIGKADPFREAQGTLMEDGIEIEFGGACPVQGDGTVDGRTVYYRSRGSGWEFSVAPIGSTDALGANCWEYGETPYHWPDGGWVHADVSRECIRRAVAKWRAEGRP